MFPGCRRRTTEPLGEKQSDSGNRAWEWGRKTGQKSLAKKRKENVKGVSLNVTERSPRDQGLNAKRLITLGIGKSIFYH